MEQTSSSPSTANRMAGGLLPTVAPVVLILIGYIDPGKWATCFDVGARFGGDLVVFALAFNFVAVLCHYLSARITIVTGRNLTQVRCKTRGCTDERVTVVATYFGVGDWTDFIFPARVYSEMAQAGFEGEHEKG